MNSEQFIDVNYVITCRKLEVCKIIKEQLLKNGIRIPMSNLAKSVNVIHNLFFLTTHERTSGQISLQTSIHHIIKENPNVLHEIYNNLYK